MRRASAGLMIGVVVMSALSVAYGAVALRTQGPLEESLRAEIEGASPELFTVLVLPPGYEDLGPQGLTPEQIVELRSRLSKAAEAATVSCLRKSARILGEGGSPELKPAVPYLAVSSDYFDLMEFSPAEGRFFTDEEERTAATVCVVGGARPEAVESRHSDVPGGMTTSYTVVGRMPIITGDLFPLPRIWGSMLVTRDGKPIQDRVVFTPATARAPLSYLQNDPADASPTWLVPLVAPDPGQSEAARAVVRQYMEEVWPGAVLDFGLSGWTAMVLQHASVRVRSYGRLAFVLMLTLCVIATAGFMTLVIARRRKPMAIERSLGKSRLLIVLEAAGGAGALAMVGSLLGALVGSLLLGDYLQEQLLAGGLWPLLRRLGWIGGSTVVAGCLAGLGTVFWATAAPPIQGLRKASVVSARRAIDLRLLLAVLAVSLGSGVLACLLVSSRSSVVALSGYLQSVGERVILVEQDIFRAQRPLDRGDFLGPSYAAILRESLPKDWAIVCQSVTTVTVTRPDGVSQSATALGLDIPWPEEAGYRLSTGTGPAFEGQQGAPLAYLGDQLAKKLFGAGPAVGQELIVGGAVRTVIGGVLQPRPEGVPDRLGDRDDCLYVSHDTLRRATDLNPPRTTTEVWAYLPPGLDKDQGVADVQAIVDGMGGRRTGLAVEANIDQVSRLSHLESRLAGQQVLLAIIALASTAWLVGLVMLARLADRLRETGLRRAVGAPSWRLGLQVVGETVLVSATGGVLGSGLGVLLAAQYCRANNWPTVSVVAGSLEVLVGVVLLGLLAALAPLRRILGTEPMNALREGEV